MLLALFAVEQLGCSFLFIRPPRQEQVEELGCVESVAAPVLDTIGATLLLTVSTVAVVTYMNETYCPVGGGFAPCPVTRVHNAFPVEALALIVPGLLLAASAPYGYVETATCRRFRSAPELRARATWNVPGQGDLPERGASISAQLGDRPPTPAQFR